MHSRILVLVAIACLVAACARHQEKATDLEPKFRLACWKGDLDQVKALFAKGVPLEEGDAYLRTPLILAAHGSPEVVKFLLAQGAKVNAMAKNGDSAFGIACEHGVLENAQMLLAAGADINHANQWGRTPLMLAAREGHDDVVSFLIAQHVDVNLGQVTTPAIFCAIRSDHISTVQLLLDAGAKLSLPADIKPVDPNNLPCPAMVYAATTGDVKMADFLLSHGADIEELSLNHRSPLLVATFTPSRAEMVEYLLDKGANPNTADNDGTTPLISAVDQQDVGVLRLLLQHGAKIETRDKEGRTALIEAGRLASADDVQELIRDKADVNATDVHQQTALTYAGDRGRFAIVQWLKDAGAKLIDLYIIPREEENPPLSRAKLWAISVGAIYAQHNGDSHLSLLEHNPSSTLEMLKRDWETTNRGQLLKNLQDLKDGSAQHGTIGAVGVPLNILFPASSPDPEWPEKMKIAWNECRAVNLVRAGVTVHFLTEAEAWPMLMDIAHKTQATFQSWKEMSNAFLDGRQVWAREHDPDFDLCAQLLLNPADPNSPWNQLDWNTSLDDASGP